MRSCLFAKQEGMFKSVTLKNPSGRGYLEKENIPSIADALDPPEQVIESSRVSNQVNQPTTSAGTAFVTAEDPNFVGDFLSVLREDEFSDILRSAPTRPKSKPKSSVSTGGESVSAKKTQTFGSTKTKSSISSPEAADARTSEARGRLVLNHSTHIPGLITVLQRLTGTAGISTIIPGRLYTAGGKEAKLALRVTVPTEGGFKLIARKGSQTQEVFVVTDLDAETLRAAIAWSL
jgi:hypothetical protein